MLAVFIASTVSLVETFRFSLVFVAILLLTKYMMGRKRSIKLPPGPKGLPVVGNIFQLGEMPHLKMTEWAKKYGPVYRLQLGSKMAIVVNGSEAIKQALLRQPMDFVSRPEMYSSTFICRGHSVAFGSLPVEEHRRYRKLITDALSSYALRKVKSDQSDKNNNTPEMITKPRPIVERIVNEEVSSLAERLLKNAEDNGSDHEIHGIDEERKEMTGIFNEIAWTTSNIICAFMFGERYKAGDSHVGDNHIKFVIDNNNDFSRTRGASSAADMMPWIRFVVPGILNKFIGVTKKFDDFIQAKIQKHWDNFDNVYDWENREQVPVETTNVVDGLVETCRKNRGNPQYNDTQTMDTVVDIMGAGFDTTSKALMWLFVYAAVFEDAQEKMKREIDAFINKNKRSPSYSERSEFPYTNAFIHEVLRHSSFVPFTIPHAVTRDNVRLHGYDMPKGTIVFINQWSVNHDELMWRSPETFRPERFLDADGVFQQEMGDKVLLFGMGRRICPGKTLAKLEMFLYVTEILQQCRLSMHPDHPGLPATEYGLTMRPETGKMIVEPR